MLARPPTLVETLHGINATLQDVSDPTHRAWLEMFRDHWWSESTGDLAFTRTTLAERVVFRRYGTPIIGIGVSLDTRDQVMERYQRTRDSGLGPGGPLEETRWSFGSWGIAVEGIFASFSWGRNLRGYDAKLDPDAAYLSRFRMSALLPFEAATGLLAGEILYAGEVLELKRTDQEEYARIRESR